MAMKYRRPGQTTPTRSFPLTPPGEGTVVGQWVGYLAILIGIVLAVAALVFAGPALQVVSLVLLAVLLAGVMVIGVRGLLAVVAPRDVPTHLWTLLAGALVVAAALGAVAARALF